MEWHIAAFVYSFRGTNYVISEKFGIFLGILRTLKDNAVFYQNLERISQDRTRLAIFVN